MLDLNQEVPESAREFARVLVSEMILCEALEDINDTLGAMQV